MNARVVLTTAGNKSEAESIAHTLVERGLAACVNVVGPIVSIYRWEGKIENAEEWLLLAKTTASAYPLVQDAIRELHSYDLPECIAVEIDSGSPDYLSWIAQSVVS
jgi:periplasmic divalent cation tolerance protein